MRPVNLIPPDERRGERAPLRAGSLSYVLVGGLAAVLIGVVVLVTTGNTIAEHKNDVDQLQSQLKSAQQEAEALKPYADFASLRVSREATITSLAKSRFDWQRVMRELALVVPSDIALTALSGQTSVDASTGGDSASTASALSNGTTGPTVTFSGCGKDHDAVARFLADLQDIDGVTRVGLQSSSRSTDQASTGGTSTTSATSGSCSGGHPAKFEILATFDGVPAPQVAGAAPAATTAPAAPVPASSSTTTPPATSEPAASTTASDGVSDGAAEVQSSKDSSAAQTSKARKAAGLVGVSGGGK